MVKENRQKQVDFRAFTIMGNGFLNHIKMKVGIAGHQPDDPRAAGENQYMAVVSTMDQRSAISVKVVRILGLVTREEKGVDVAYVDLCLPNSIRIENIPIQVTEKITSAGCDCVIGMDILACGDCSLSSNGNRTMFSFRVPSLGAEDFVKTHNKLHKKRLVTTMATRNQLCPCGSGRKHKNCCGKIL